MNNNLIKNDSTPMRIGDLAIYMDCGVNTIYRDVNAGYFFEFATHKKTTPGHYKAWLREEATKLAKRQADQAKADRERRERELCHLHTDVDKSSEQPSSRGSRTASPGPAKSLRSAQLA